MGFIDDIGSLTGLPFEILKGDYRVVCFGRRAVYIDGIKNISAFSEQRISLKLNKGFLEIMGENLCLKMLSKDDIMILGDIKTINGV